MRNVLVLLADGLRADALGSSRDRSFLERYHLAAGHSTPELDRFLDRGVRFERAYASGTEALPSLATLLTGCHPPRHGVRCPCHGRASGVDTLWEAFGRAGYRTLLANGPEGAGALGLAAGCDQLFSGSDLELFAELEAESEKPVLAVCRFSDVEPPYLLSEEPPEPGYLAEYLSELRALSARYAMEISVPLALEDDPERLADVWRALDSGLFARGLAQPVENLLPIYVKGIRKFDRGRFRAFRERLDASPLAADAVVVLTALFAETVYRPTGSPCDLLNHGTPPLEGAVHVPLGIVAPGLPAGARIEGPVGHVDLAATLGELAGVDPPAGCQGRSLAPAAAGGALSPRPCYSEHARYSIEGPLDGWYRKAGEAGELPPHRCLLERRDLREDGLLYAETGDQLRTEDLQLPPAELVQVLYLKLLGRLPREEEVRARARDLETGSTDRRRLVHLLLRQAKLENRYRLHEPLSDPEERVNLLALDEEGRAPAAARMQSELVRISLDLPEGAPIDRALRLDPDS